MDPPLPVPKPRSRYKTDSLSSLVDTEVNRENQQAATQTNGVHTDANDGDATFPTLAGVTSLIAANIPSLAGLASSIGGHTNTHTPSSNPEDANAKLAPEPEPEPDDKPTAGGALGPDSIFSSLASFPGWVNDSSASGATAAANPEANATTTMPSAPLATPTTTPGASDMDVGALCQLVMSSLDQKLNLVETTESPYVTVLSSWASQEDESSNEEEESVLSPAPFSSPPSEEPMGVEPAASLPANLPIGSSGRLVPMRPAPPPPTAKSQSAASSTKPQKKPRAATIKVSRKKGAPPPPSITHSAVVRHSWLDVWKGFRHNVLWATLDGQVMSLWKKRTDRFSELLFHVSSITNVKKQDKGRFSVCFKKKHYDFMAHNDEVHDGWVSSLLACRGTPSPAPPEFHGPITVKEPRNSKAYGALWAHELWIYPSKDAFSLGTATLRVPMNVAAVKQAGKHSFNLITPYKSFSLSVDSSKDLSVWMEKLAVSISGALSCSQVALRLWENTDCKVCAECSAANPEWASVNLLLLVCHNCAGVHRSLGSSLSKIRSLKMDSKVWTEPLIQLFVAHGNRLANQLWACGVPGDQQLRSDSSDEERQKFINDKYRLGKYRRMHALTNNQSLMDQRLCQVAVGDDIEETMSLICSGAKVSRTDPQSTSPILLAERAGKALQTELLRLNEYTDVPPYVRQSSTDSTPSEGEELHGKLEDERFLFSLENDSAACDVLDLREVLSVFLHQGPSLQFEMVTLTDQLICAADSQEVLMTHLLHILKVILPGGVSYAEVCGARAASSVCVLEVGGASEAWLLLYEDGVSVHPVQRNTHQQTFTLELGDIRNHEMDPSENIITMATADRSVSLRFEELHSANSWFKQLQDALTNHRAENPPTANHRAENPPTANHSRADTANHNGAASPAANQRAENTPPTNHRAGNTPPTNQRASLYPVLDVKRNGKVPAAVERCVSHITNYGLKVEGVYRRCGLASKVSLLVDALMTSPGHAQLEKDEQGVLDAGSALKQYVRQISPLIPIGERGEWLKAAVLSEERSRFSAYRRLLRKLPDDNRATLNALFGHFYMVQVFSQVNKMSAHNLAVVLVPTLFESMSPDLLRLTREFIIHHTLLFLTPEEKEEEEKEEEITVF